MLDLLYAAWQGAGCLGRPNSLNGSPAADRGPRAPHTLLKPQNKMSAKAKIVGVVSTA
jgi:hypothetical protein